MLKCGYNLLLPIYSISLNCTQKRQETIFSIVKDIDHNPSSIWNWTPDNICKRTDLNFLKLYIPVLKHLNI